MVRLTWGEGGEEYYLFVCLMILTHRGVSKHSQDIVSCIIMPWHTNDFREQTSDFNMVLAIPWKASRKEGEKEKERKGLFE